MSFGGFAGGPGFGGPGAAQGPAGWGPGGFGGHGFGGQGGFGGHGFGGPGGFGGHGFGGGLKRAAFGTAALLLDGPADAAGIVQRTSEATGGAFSPPRDVVDLAIGLLAGRGLVTVENGVASLTELGSNLLAWRGVTSDSTHMFLSKFAQFADVLTIGRTLHEVGGLARTIAWSGTEAQKQALSDAKAQVLDAVTKAKKSLHAALAAD